MRFALHIDLAVDAPMGRLYPEILLTPNLYAK